MAIDPPTTVPARAPAGEIQVSRFVRDGHEWRCFLGLASLWRVQVEELVGQGWKLHSVETEHRLCLPSAKIFWFVEVTGRSLAILSRPEGNGS